MKIEVSREELQKIILGLHCVLAEMSWDMAEDEIVFHNKLIERLQSYTETARKEE